MKQFRASFAIFIARVVTALLHLFGRGATSLPGMVALKLCPNVLQSLSRDVDAIFITGTNGKTTTTHMIAKILEDAKIPFFTNDAGANMITGITTAFINKKQKIKDGDKSAERSGAACSKTACSSAEHNAMQAGSRQVALMECDEASLRKVTPFIQPRIIVVTNFFRDQLDRYGEISTTLNLVKDGIELAGSNTTLCLNADCSYTASLGRDFKGKVLYFGFAKAAAEFGAVKNENETAVAQALQNSEISQAAEALSCLFCGNAYSYEYHNFGHLGAFYCSECGWKRPNADVEVEEILELAPAYSRLMLKCGAVQQPRELKVSLAAKFNIYNAASAVCVARAFELNTDEALSSLEHMSSSFGRMESFELNSGTSLLMLLTKNPTGADQVIEYVQTCLSQTSQAANIVLCLNDKAADGKDISWVWDVNYEQIATLNCNKIIVWGTRAHDMRVRLLYAGVDRDKIELIQGNDALFDAICAIGGEQENKTQVYLLANYTSMMELRDFFAQKCGKKAFWDSSESGKSSFQNDGGGK